ncbi:MAG TPA: hypothetical protein VII06_09645 [Chloroflexota bacterium]|jgi:hypothetical protein
MQVIGFRDTMTTYVVGPSGRFDQVDATNVPCSLIDLGRQPGATAEQRAELGALRGLMWAREYEMPSEYVQIEVDGVRWTPTPGNFHLARFPSGMPLYRYTDVMRAKT